MSKHKPLNGYADDWYAKNREKVLEQRRERYRNDPKHRKAKTQYNREHRNENRERTAEWRKSHPTRISAWWLKTKYGITVEQYEALLEKQGHKCAICGKPHSVVPYKRLNVDHDHKTGKVRGMLCHDCNLAIGFFLDDVSLLEAAIRYLQSA